MTKILVVDESPSVRTLVGEALEQRHVEILAAESGAQAVERIERDRPDLVVCDVYMPDMDGYRICDFVRANPELRAIPVLLMADVVDRSVLARAARVGSADVVRKPTAADELLSRIEDLLRGAPGQPAGGTEDLSTDAEVPPDAEALLATLAARPGVSFAALVDHEGFLIDWAGEMAPAPEVVAALASCLAESSEGIGRELGQGALQNMIFEYNEGLVLLMGAGHASRLAVVLRDPATLEAIRAYVRHVVPALTHAL
jgi:CheY-like chemotaxis protein